MHFPFRVGKIMIRPREIFLKPFSSKDKISFYTVKKKRSYWTLKLLVQKYHLYITKHKISFKSNINTVDYISYFRIRLKKWSNTYASKFFSLLLFVYKLICITEIFNSNISHQLFDYKITLTGDFELKNFDRFQVN